MGHEHKHKRRHQVYQGYIRTQAESQEDSSFPVQCRRKTEKRTNNDGENKPQHNTVNNKLPEA